MNTKTFLSLAVLLFCLVSSILPAHAQTAPVHNRRASLTQIGRIGGPSLAVVARGTTAFVGFSFELAVIDMYDPSDPQRIAYLPLSANDLALAGDLLFVAGRDRLTIVDVQQVRHPMIVGSLRLDDAMTGIAIKERTVYATGALGSFWVIDVHSPAHPTIRSTQRVARRAEGVAIADEFALLTTYDGLTVIDISNPAQPRTIGSTKEPGWSQSVVKQGTRLYVTTQTGLAIVDFSNPARPTQLALVPLPGYGDGLAVIGNYAIVANGTQGLQVIDIAPVHRPRIVATAKTQGALLDVVVEDGVAYATDLLEGGLHSFDLRTPSKPVPIGDYLAPARTRSVAVSLPTVYLSAGASGDLYLIDASKSEQLMTIATVATAGVSQKLFVEGKLLAVANQTGQIEVYYIRRQAEPILMDVIELSADVGVMAIIAGVLHTVTQDGWLRLFQLDANGQTEPIYTAQLERSALALLVGDKGDLLATIGNPRQANNLLKISSLLSPVAIKRVVANERYAFAFLADQRLAVLDHIKPGSSPIIGEVAIPGDVFDMTIEGNLLYLALGSVGVQVVDVTDPTNPTVIATFDTPDQAQTIAVENDRVFVDDRFGGLLVLSFSVNLAQ